MGGRKRSNGALANIEHIAEPLRSLAVPIESLTLDPANARAHGERNLKAIESSLARFGQRAPLVVQRDGMVVRAGNGRLEAAKALGWSHIAALVVDESSIDATAFAIADNRTAELAEWDDSTLAALLGDLQQHDVDIAEIGFDQKELDKLLAADAPPVEEDEVPDSAPPRVKAGELWQLGRHRVLCGDATSADDVGRVMGEKNVGLCLTDPPYGIGQSTKAPKIESRTKKDVRRQAYRSFDDTPGQVEAMAEKWLPLARQACGAVVFSPGIRGLWWYPRPDWVFCWFYGGGQLRSSWGFNCWQPFLCYGKDPSLAKGMGARPDSVNMNTPANAADIDHPCPKPMKLWAWMLERLPVDDVYDPFLGSGTTLIVAEQLNRTCYGLEIEPKYCDVILARWEALTGERAKKL